jgi:uncharacterized membrane protein
LATILKQRVQSIDLLRGIIMIIMALDHVRDYFHAGSFLYNPLDLEKTNGLVFFTRWVTHFCAPVFMLLAGVSAFLMSQRKTKKELSFFLLTRGAWLVFLELVIVNFGWNFNIAFPNILLVTIWALGISMVVLAGFIHLPLKAILVISVGIIAGHNLLDGVHVSGNTLPAFGWALLHEQNFFSWGGEGVLVGYPLVPWIAVMPLGYCLGQLYTSSFDPARRKRILLQTGAATTLAFIIIRFINVYGDPVPWSAQKNPFFTLLSFINVNKYPPSLLYLLVTLGPALLFLGVTEQWKGRAVAIITVYGRVPMFYYLVHIYLIHVLAMIASGLFTTVGFHNWVLRQPIWFNTDLTGYGFSLVVVYAVWLAVVIGIYPLCKRYDAYKQAHKEKWWLSYL